jgi:predicted nucleic acid-binding protein
MLAVKASLDVNVLVYMYSNDEHDKRDIALNKISRYYRTVSAQVLSEFCNVCIRKVKLDLHRLKIALNEICKTNTVSVINKDTVKQALCIHNKYRFSYYDSLIIASALETKCDFLLSEDMADGQIIENTLTIRNIFSKEFYKG